MKYLFLILLLINFYSCKKNEYKNEKIVKYEKFEKLVTSTIDGKPINTDSLEGKIKIMILFSPNDCQSCLNEIIFWNSSQKYFDNKISVFGIISYPHRLVAVRYLNMLNINIPVIFDSSSELKNKFKISMTPGRIIINNNGYIIHKSDYSNRDVRLEKIIDTIKTILNF